MEKEIYEKAHKLNVQIDGVTRHWKNLTKTTIVIFKDIHAESRTTTFRKGSETYGVIAEELRLHAMARLCEYKMKLEKELKEL